MRRWAHARFTLIFLGLMGLISFSGAPALALCTGPSGIAGTIFFNSDHSVLQYCDDSVWRALGDIQFVSGGGGGGGPSDLIHYWTMDEQSGGTITDSIGTNNGTWTDGVNNDVAEETLAGQIDTALDFGTNRYAYMAGLTLPDEGTFTAWIKTDFDDSATPGGNHWMLADTPTPRFSLKYNTSTGDYELTTNGTVQTSFTPGVDYTDWFHLGVTWSTSGSQFYKDGAAVGTAGTGDDSTDSPTNFYMATRTALDRWFNGKIDDVRIYDRALTAQEIDDIYNGAGTGPLPTSCTSPVMPRGGIFYNSSGSVLQYCNGSDWVALGVPPNNGPCTTIGQQCLDGSIFAGDTNLYVADVDQSASIQWKATQGNDDVNPDSTTDGAANHANVTVAINTLPAMDLCETLDRHGHQDWYLPAEDELNLLWNGGSPIAGVITDGTYYWTSTEATSFGTRAERFNDGGQTGRGKTLNSAVRCVRRGTGALALATTGDACTNPTAAKGTIFYNANAKRHQYCNGDEWIGFILANDGTSGVVPAASAPAVLENSSSDFNIGIVNSHTHNFGFTGTSGRLLVAVMSWDKNISAPSETSTEWTQAEFLTANANVSGAIYYKISDGTETSISLSWSNSRDMSIWVGEYSGIATTSPLDQMASANSGDTAVNSQTSGTTATTSQADTFAIAMFGIDSGANANTGAALTNGFTEQIFLCDTCTGDPGLIIATKSLSATEAVETTHSNTDNGDQMVGIVAVFKRE